MDRDNFLESLRLELIDIIQERLTPIALEHGYAEVPLETSVKWRPLVLVLGNYSSGKSTLINELVGVDIQATGQAPTDDSFTVISYNDEADAGETAEASIRRRDGKVLLGDPQYPFESLRRHGQRFAAHFRLTQVRSPFLQNLALIDTPGMLDSVSERDRGYEYQDVIGDLAQIADLVLILFDPHKAGTIREAHASLRDTLPRKTFEDRVLFVLNRVDECSNLNDLLRVYGTLCWNLSQMTGRKDIPMIHLTYSEHAAARGGRSDDGLLNYLDNQRQDLKNAILQAPRHRLDHLASYVEMHAERLGHLIEALLAYKWRRRKFWVKLTLAGGLVAAALGVGAWFGSQFYEPVASLGPEMRVGTAIGLGVVALGLWITVGARLFLRRFHGRQLRELETLTPLRTQDRRDSWRAVEEMVRDFLTKKRGRFAVGSMRSQLASCRYAYDKGAREVRAALNEAANLSGGRQSSW